MKSRVFQILVVLAVAAAGAVFLSHKSGEKPAAETTVPRPSAEKNARPKKMKEPERRIPEPPAVSRRSPAIAQTAPQKKVSPPQSAVRQPPARKTLSRPLKEQRRDAMIKRWKQAEEQFNRLWDRLDGTADPSQRERLINNMAQYVRMNTPEAIEWAMSLLDPEERRMALESINKYAISGIGARINVDATGFPKIMETTALSAVESTGMVEPGDYIIGMVNAEGQAVDFEGMPVHQIIQYLRGEPGSELLLLMERAPSDPNGEAYPFDVPVQRSLLVIQPPY